MSGNSSDARRELRAFDPVPEDPPVEDPPVEDPPVEDPPVEDPPQEEPEEPIPEPTAEEKEAICEGFGLVYTQEDVPKLPKKFRKFKKWLRKGAKHKTWRHKAKLAQA